ncbi:hypothetical protein C0991_008310 [Blastosporella zonata]|nr:hypothetical protein C0991_008310 [Blastosporella zonata]
MAPSPDSEPAPIASSFYTDFKPVNRKKRKSKSTRDKEPLLNEIQHLRDQLGRDDWLPECQRLLSESFLASPMPEEALCLGLGSPSTSPTARVQLAFLLAMCQYLNIVCDPSGVDSEIQHQLLSGHLLRAVFT